MAKRNAPKKNVKKPQKTKPVEDWGGIAIIGGVRRPPPTTWDGVVARLAASLADMRGGDFLIVSAKHGNIYVQFAAQGDEMRVEAASNTYLDEGHRLSPAVRKRMLGYGWHAPWVRPKGYTGPPKESPNYHRDFVVPLPHQKIAECAVETLRDVYGIQEPAELQYEGFTKPAPTSKTSGN